MDRHHCGEPLPIPEHHFACICPPWHTFGKKNGETWAKAPESLLE
jgi:hypothetical protein